MKITGTHKGQAVTITFSEATAQELLERNQRILDKAQRKNAQFLVERYSPIIAAWKAIIEKPELINAAGYEKCKKEYINNALFSEDGWKKQFS